MTTPTTPEQARKIAEHAPYPATQNALRSLADQVEALTAENYKLQERMDQIFAWAEAYPLAIFPEPDFKKAHEVLSAAGMTLDAISASNMRHVITKVAAIAKGTK